jgi:hypothetical protein
LTATLAGRWQTRALLMLVLGVPICLAYEDLFPDRRTPLAMLGYVFVFGLVWDVFYHWLQSYRWDRDWPPIFQLAGGVAEGLVVAALMAAQPLWDALDWEALPGTRVGVPMRYFVVHYATVFLAMFCVAQGPIKVFLPRWRFRGGRVV